MEHEISKSSFSAIDSLNKQELSIIAQLVDAVIQMSKSKFEIPDQKWLA